MTPLSDRRELARGVGSEARPVQDERVSIGQAVPRIIVAQTCP